MGTKLVRMLVAVTAIGWAGGVTRGGASWVGQPYTLAIPTHITAVGQASGGSLDITLQHDGPCSIGISVAQTGDEVLSTTGGTLATSYMLSGSRVTNGDGTWVSSNVFLTRTYSVVGTGPEDTITLAVQGVSAPDRAAEAGVYSANIIMTVSW